MAKKSKTQRAKASAKKAAKKAAQERGEVVVAVEEEPKKKGFLASGASGRCLRTLSF